MTRSIEVQQYFLQHGDVDLLVDVGLGARGELVYGIECDSQGWVYYNTLSDELIGSSEAIQSLRHVRPFESEELPPKYVDGVLALLDKVEEDFQKIRELWR